MLGRTRDRRGKGKEDGDRRQTENDDGKQNLYESVAGLGSARPLGNAWPLDILDKETRRESHDPDGKRTPRNMASRPVPTMVTVSWVGAGDSSMTVPVLA
jgi:hypothetical protein